MDIVQALTQQPDFQTARKYWNKLKERLGKEGSQLVTNCNQLKLTAALITTWVTLLPRFLFVFLGTPHVESLRERPALAMAVASWLAMERFKTGVIPTLAACAHSASWSKSSTGHSGLVNSRIGQERDHLAESARLCRNRTP